LLKPHVPLRYADPKKLNPDFLFKNLKLWSEASPDISTPATVALGQEKIQFNVEIKYWGSSISQRLLSDEKVEVIGTNQDGTEVLTSGFVITDNAQTQVAPVYLHSWSLVIPWGIKESILWAVRITRPDGSSEILKMNKTPFSIFAVTSDIAPYHKSDRIPVEFLELFVLPTITAELTSLADWQKWVIRKCFGSTFDSDFKQKLQNTKDESYDPRYKDFECIHSYRYDTKSGGTQFVEGSYQTVFNLDAWLLNRKGFKYINCYDQSALLQTALTLGVQWTFVDAEGKPQVDKNGNKLQSVGRLWKSPFGFIPKSDLVGWGRYIPTFQPGRILKD